MSQDQDIDQDGPNAPDLDDGIGVDPLGDADDLSQNQAKKNYAKVGSARPTTLLYTYGPGAIIDLPHFTVMPTGLDDWARIWRRRAADPVTVHAPRLLETVQLMLGHQVSCGASPGSPLGRVRAVTAMTWGCRRGFSPSGCAVPVVTCWRRSADSSTATTTPTPSGPTRPSSSTSTALGAPTEQLRPRDAGVPRAQPSAGADDAYRACLPVTSSSARVVTSMSTPTTGGSTRVPTVPRPPTPSSP